MRINADTKLNFNVNSAQGKYYKIKRNGTTLNVMSTSKKPKGGAKSTLKNIQVILERIDLDASSKTTLCTISKNIEKGYTQKNGRKFLYKSHSKKVRKLTERITTLTTVPPPPADVFSIMGQFLDLKTIGRLDQVSKAARGPVNIDWLRRAQALGMPRTIKSGDEAKAFCRELKKTIDKIPGLRTWATFSLTHPTHTITSQYVNTLITNLVANCWRRYDFDQHPALLHFLVHKTQNVQGITPNGYFLTFAKFESPKTLILMAKLMKIWNWGPNLNHFITSDIPYPIAKRVLNLVPILDIDALLHTLSDRCSTWMTPLGDAVLKGYANWTRALIEQKADVNRLCVRHDHDRGVVTQSSPLDLALITKNTEIISLLTDAGARIPKDLNFFQRLFKGHPSVQVMPILKALQKENDLNTAHLLNTVILSRMSNSKRTLLQLAIKHNHSSEVLKKLIDLGAELNPAKRSRSPLLYANKHKKHEAAAFLIGEGATPPKKG